MSVNGNSKPSKGTVNLKMNKAISLILVGVVAGIVSGKVSYEVFFYQWKEAEIRVRKSENIVYDKIISHLENNQVTESINLISTLKNANKDLIGHLSGESNNL